MNDKYFDLFDNFKHSLHDAMRCLRTMALQASHDKNKIIMEYCHDIITDLTRIELDDIDALEAVLYDKPMNENINEYFDDDYEMIDNEQLFDVVYKAFNSFWGEMDEDDQYQLLPIMMYKENDFCELVDFIMEDVIEAFEIDEPDEYYNTVTNMVEKCLDKFAQDMDFD